MASTMEVMARARAADGQDAVLKVGISDAGFASQVRTLRLLASDIERHVMLLEALGASVDSFLERVSPGLFALACGANDVARAFLDTAELLA